MATFTVWIDSSKAKIFHMQSGDNSHEILKRHEVLHHTSSDSDKLKNSARLFQDTASHLTGASEILILGPGLAKTHFLDYLKTHHHEGIAKAVVGVETTDHPTDKQVLDYAHKFFRKTDVFR